LAVFEDRAHALEQERMMPSRSKHPMNVLLASFTYVACSGSEPPSLESLEWHTSETPVVRIGVDDGDTHYQLHQVQDVQRFSDGRIVLASGGSNEVRFYEVDGRYQGESGGPGDGPGEFRSLSSVAVAAGDSLIALDRGNGRVSILDPSGRYVRSGVAESPGRALSPVKVHVLGDGSVLISYVRGHRPSDPPGLFRGSAPLVRYSPDGEILNVVADMPGDEWYYSEEHSTLSDRPFGRKGHLAVGQNEIYIGSGEAEVLVFKTSGELSRTMAVEPPEAVTADHIRAYGEERLQRVSDADRRPAIQRQLAEMPYPQTMPSYAGLLVDSDGNLWTKEFAFPSRSAVRWKVRSQEGGVIATVSLPAAFRPSFADSQHIGGVITDELDVEYVVIFQLRQEQPRRT
jgi:hypothetical protein